MMKKCILALLLITAIPCSSTFAVSDWRFGVKAGGNISMPEVNTPSSLQTRFDSKMRPDFYFGGLVQYELADMVKLDAELLYQGDGFKYDYRNMTTHSGPVPNGSGTQSIATLNLPIYAKYQYSQKISVQLGLVIGMVLKAQNDYDSSFGNIAELDKFDYKTIQYGAMAGVSYNLTKLVFVDARYNFYFNNLSKSDISYKPRGFQVGIGYYF